MAPLSSLMDPRTRQRGLEHGKGTWMIDSDWAGGWLCHLFLNPTNLAIFHSLYGKP